MQAALQRSNSRLGLIAACGLVCAAAVVFGRVVANDWVDFDDYPHVAKNPLFFPVNWRSLRAVWTPGCERLYVPVSYTVFAAECVASRVIAGGTPTSDPPAALFHGVSLGLHAAVVLGVFTILRRIVSSAGAAAAGAMLFAVHPLQVESVAWAFEQRGLLAAALSLAAVLLLLRMFESRGTPQLLSSPYIAATALLALALLSKPIAVVTPLIALALLVHLHQPTPKMVAQVLLPWVMLAVGTALLTRAVQPAVVMDRDYPWLCRPLIAGDALAFYMAKIAIPADLCVQYGRTPRDVLADPRAPLWAIGVGVALVAAFTLRPATRVRLPLALFLVPLTPVLGLTSFDFQLQSTVADRYVYLGMLGPAVALALVAEQLWTHQRWQRTGAIGITVWLCLLGVLAARQVGVWRDTGTLASQACRVTPRAPWAWILLASHNLQVGDPLVAAACANRALVLQPSSLLEMFSMAEAACQLSDDKAIDAAHAKLLESGAQDTDLVYGLYHRGVAHLHAGRSGRAEKYFTTVLKWDSDYLPALINLGVILSRRAEHGMAEDLFRTAVAKDPQQVAAWVGLGNALYTQGRAGEAVECFSKALDIEPGDADTLANRAWARVAAGDRRGAESDLGVLRQLGRTPDPELVDAVMQPDAGGEGGRR